MNSKEFVNKLIVFSKEQINYYENKVVEDEKYPSLQQCHKEELKSTQEGLNHFLKIKQDIDRLEQLEKENQELKEAITILKEVSSLNCDKTLETERQFLRLTKEEYELLKEVFESVGGEDAKD